MKSFTIKNYKGSIVESLARFQKKYPGSRILEAHEEDSTLKIKAESDDDNWEQIPDMGSFSHALHMAIDRSAADWYDDFLTDPKNNEQVEQFLEDLKRFAKWFDLPNINNKYQKEEFANLKKGIDEFEHDWREYHKRHSANESFTKSGEIHFDENGECRDNIKPIWHQILKYPKDEETIYANGNTYIYCVVMTSSLTEHFWAVYEGQDVRSKSDTSLSVPDYLIKHLPEGVETNESLSRGEDDELYFDVLNWFYDNYSAQNDITDQQWKDLANDIDKNAEVFMKLLDDLGLQGADDEVKDRAHELLVDFVDAEL